MYFELSLIFDFLVFSVLEFLLNTDEGGELGEDLVFDRLGDDRRLLVEVLHEEHRFLDVAIAL